MAVRAEPARRPQAPLAAPRPGRPPAALAALLLVTAIMGVAWAFVTPAFQAPDENSHFGYVQTLAERFALPGRAGRQPLSPEQVLAGSLSNSDQAAQQLAVRMEWSRAEYDRWRALAAALPHAARTAGRGGWARAGCPGGRRRAGGPRAAPPRPGGGPTPGWANPPLYYLYEAVPYRLAEGGDLFTRLTVTRLASVLWMLLTVAGVWL